ncbi:hypothetical protein [Lysobacter xanthus]
METLSQAQLVERLSEIFPLFRGEWAADTGEVAFPSNSLHSVYQSFLPFVATAEATAAQITKLSALVSSEVAAGGERENAVSTCFLEHCGQVGFARQLSALLSAAARSRLHA